MIKDQEIDSSKLGLVDMTSQLDWNAGPWARANLKVTTLIVLAALVLPWLLFDSATGRFILHLLILFMAWCIVTQSWNLIMGVGGIFSFAQVALFAVGGLASGVVSQQFGISPFLTIWLGPIAATAAALVIGLPSLRLRGPYVVLLTLAFAELLRNFASQGPNWVAGGGYGLRYVPKFGFEEMWGTGLGRVAYYYVAFILFGVTTYLIWRIFHSPIGMSFRALRDSETYATSRGVDPFRFKLLLFAISAFFTGLAGGFLVHYNGAQSPAILNFSLTITLLAMVVLGGWGTFWGPILGTAMLTALPELLRGADNYRNMAIGASLALIAIFAPEGLFPLISQKVKKFLRDINNR